MTGVTSSHLSHLLRRCFGMVFGDLQFALQVLVRPCFISDALTFYPICMGISREQTGLEIK